MLDYKTLIELMKRPEFSRTGPGCFGSFDMSLGDEGKPISRSWYPRPEREATVSVRVEAFKTETGETLYRTY